ncbi:hypothetical protein [Mesorhizobium neociceri]|uniref:Uncharacterized protein n=1 Tax=Mesorhizobium neociceri TaxID=1307853 RepID=A0A838BA10_9HYPH|nr:hypothetical protein [Mesorhizobium neociceri]MBA1143033.1 hypothetical protein [Mesorhizobium neociceri]
MSFPLAAVLDRVDDTYVEEVLSVTTMPWLATAMAAMIVSSARRGDPSLHRLPSIDLGRASTIEVIAPSCPLPPRNVLQSRTIASKLASQTVFQNRLMRWM